LPHEGEPFRRDPHQKTFTIAAARPDSVLLRGILQSCRSVLAPVSQHSTPRATIGAKNVGAGTSRGIL
jgi:hypothetical protein